MRIFPHVCKCVQYFAIVSHTCPPAAHAATRPYWPPSFCSRWATVVTSLQPVAANGCPRDREPPHVLNFSIGGTPTWENNDREFSLSSTLLLLNRRKQHMIRFDPKYLNRFFTMSKVSNKSGFIKTEADKCVWACLQTF